MRSPSVISSGSPTWRCPLAGLAVIGNVLYEMDSAAKIMGAVWIALGLVYFAVHTIILKKPAAIDP